MDDENKFIKYLDSADWPGNMNKIRSNLPRSTMLDEEIMSNSGNRHTVLQSVKAALKKIYPKRFLELELR